METIQQKARKCLFTKSKNNHVQSETQTIQRERTAIGSSSEEERKVNALASGAEEGRD